MLPENQKQQASLGSGDVLQEAGHVIWQPAEHAVLVLVQVLVVHHLFSPCLHVHFDLVLCRPLQFFFDALKRLDT